MPDTSFTQVWNKIRAHAGEMFSTVTGKQFVYNIDGNVVRPEHTKRNIPRSDFEKAYALMPLKGPGQINQLVQGPAYVYAILTDPRIA
jgi:hypothetical protein